MTIKGLTHIDSIIIFRPEIQKSKNTDKGRLDLVSQNRTINIVFFLTTGEFLFYPRALPQG